MRSFHCTIPRAAAARILLLIGASAASSAVHADPFTYLVGGDGAACDFSTIQAAIDAAANHAGQDVINVATNASYSAQALHIGAQDLTIIGGFASCASAAPTPGAVTLISGAGGAADSVIAVTGAGTRLLANLRISDGDDTDTSAGGGIDFAGQGVLLLSNVIVSNNRAGYGGGINFNGSGGNASLVADSDVIVQNNIAVNSGGGVRVEGSAHLYMLGAQTTVTGNEALGTTPNTGYGGGIQVIPPAIAEIGSPGFGNMGVVAFNRAKYGAGIAVSARDDGVDGVRGYALLYTTDPQQPVRVHGNIASVAGGGFYLSVNNDLTGIEETTLCAYEFRIDHNQAPDGAALFLDSDTELAFSIGATASFNVADQHCGVSRLPPAPAAKSCAPGVACNRVDGNLVRQANGQPASGAIVSMRQGSGLAGDRTAWIGNAGTDLVHGLSSSSFEVSDCLLVNNGLSGQVVANAGLARIVNCTVAGNTLGLSTVLTLSGSAIIEKSIIWQPGKVSLAPDNFALHGGFILSNDPGSLPLPATFALEPRFVDPARADYHLRAASPAIDVATPEGSSLDLDGLPHSLDLPNADAFGPRDLGAYERQSINPMVLNGNFDADLSLWNDTMAGVSAFDPNENIVNSSNAENSGAMSFNWTNGNVVLTRVTSREQCIHLPIAGVYKLNGFARTTGSSIFVGQLALLHWEFRRDGSEACNSGPADRSGDLPLASGTAWNRAAAPALIGVSEAEWTRNSSITLSTVMVSTGITVAGSLHGWFDGVALMVTSDHIFANGFE